MWTCLPRDSWHLTTFRLMAFMRKTNVSWSKFNSSHLCAVHECREGRLVFGFRVKKQPNYTKGCRARQKPITITLILVWVNAPLFQNTWYKQSYHLMTTYWQRDKKDSGIGRGEQMGGSFLLCWWSFPYVPVLIILGFWPYFRVKGFDEIFVWAGE